MAGRVKAASLLTLRWQDCPGSSGWGGVITGVFPKCIHRGLCDYGRLRGTTAGFEDGSDQKPWNIDKLQEEAGEGMKMESSPRASRKETPPTDTLVLAQ